MAWAVKSWDCWLVEVGSCRSRTNFSVPMKNTVYRTPRPNAIASSAPRCAVRPCTPYSAWAKRHSAIAANPMTSSHSTSLPND